MPGDKTTDYYEIFDEIIAQLNPSPIYSFRRGLRLLQSRLIQASTFQPNPNLDKYEGDRIKQYLKNKSYWLIAWKLLYTWTRHVQLVDHPKLSLIFQR